MMVQVQHDMMVAQNTAVINGVTCVVVSCQDVDDYIRLPEVVSYNDILCGKTGWNSDSNRAHYQSSAVMIRKVR